MQRMKSYLFSTIFIFAFLSISINPLNVCVDASNFKCPNFQALISKVDAVLTNPVQIQIPKAMRLIFHDCVSGCNGCIDQESEDNIGLNCIIGNSRRTFHFGKNLTYFGKFRISRADVITLLAQRAIYLSSNHPGLTVPVCDFKFGRKECTGPQENKEIFAQSFGNWSHVSEFFQKTFNYSTQEIIALMGAHTLGQNFPQNSGHRGPWVSQKNQVFTNQYFINLLDKEKSLEYKVHVTPEGKAQWHSAKDSCDGYPDRRKCRPKPVGQQRSMLNSDICLLKMFNTDSKGMPDCTFDTCKTDEERKNIIETYANSEPTFKKDFAAVFQKLIEHKCDNLVDPENPSNQQNDFEHYHGEKIISSIMKVQEKFPIKDQFKTYHLLFKKTYSLNSEEGIRKYRIFKKNMKIIKEKNFLTNSDSGKYGLNKFTDHTSEEYLRFVSATKKGENVDLDKLADLEIKEDDHLLLNA
jgi:hypothetical protein